MKHGKSMPPAPSCVAVAQRAAGTTEAHDEADNLLENPLEGVTSAAATHSSWKPAPRLHTQDDSSGRLRTWGKDCWIGRDYQPCFVVRATLSGLDKHALLQKIVKRDALVRRYGTHSKFPNQCEHQQALEVVPLRAELFF